VLLVDDNAGMRARAAAMLERDCTIVGSAADGPAAIQSVAELQPDVVVLDISMPGMTGLEVARRLRETGSTAALVFLTVHDDRDLVLAACHAGAIGYVIKSRLASDLKTAVCEAAAGRPFVSQLG